MRRLSLRICWRKNQNVGSRNVFGKSWAQISSQMRLIVSTIYPESTRILNPKTYFIHATERSIYVNRIPDAPANIAAACPVHLKDTTRASATETRWHEADFMTDSSSAGKQYTTYAYVPDDHSHDSDRCR